MKQWIITFFAGGLLAFGLFDVTAAGQLEDGIEAHKHGDYATAMRIWRALADRGDAAGETYLGSMYDHGRGVPQDYAQAASLYREAADQGYIAAQEALGFLYEDGQGVKQDDVAAHMWFNLAASRASGAILDAVVEQRDRIAARLTPSQLTEAQRMANEWKPTK